MQKSGKSNQASFTKNVHGNAVAAKCWSNYKVKKAANPSYHKAYEPFSFKGMEGEKVELKKYDDRYDNIYYTRHNSHMYSLQKK